jgi:hypothetical protein
MRAAKLKSSMIARIAYDDAAQTLSVWFRESGRYVYHGVPKAIYEALCAAQSAGRYFNEYVKGRYRCSFDPERRFRPPAPERHRPGLRSVGGG